MSVTSGGLIQRAVNSLKPVVEYLLEKKNGSGTRPCDHLGITATFFWPGKTSMHFLIRKLRGPPLEYGQRPHSEIPTCIILSKFRTFIPPFCNTYDSFLTLLSLPLMLKPHVYWNWFLNRLLLLVIWPHKPVIFSFPLLIFHTLNLEKQELFRSAIVIYLFVRFGPSP